MISGDEPSEKTLITEWGRMGQVRNLSCCHGDGAVLGVGTDSGEVTW